MNTQTICRTFQNSVKKGQSPFFVVQNLATKARKTPNQIWQTLKSNGFAFSTKFGNKTCWFPTFNGPRVARTKMSPSQQNFWQFFCEFGMQQGWITPSQIKAWTPQQTYWFLCNKANSLYNKPSGFNPRTTVPTFTTPSFPTATTRRKSTRTRKTTSRSTSFTTPRLRFTGTTTRRRRAA